jgi:hypothetical protein
LNTSQKLKIIRSTYWLGAIMDGLFAIVQTTIALFGLSIPLLTDSFTQGSFISDGGLTYRFAMGIGAALMWGWTVLLIWADQKPIERRGILIITVFPVVVGIFLTNIVAILNGLVTFQDFLLRLLIQVALMILLFISYHFAKEIDRSLMLND